MGRPIRTSYEPGTDDGESWRIDRAPSAAAVATSSKRSAISVYRLWSCSVGANSSRSRRKWRTASIRSRCRRAWANLSRAVRLLSNPSNRASAWSRRERHSQSNSTPWRIVAKRRTTSMPGGWLLLGCMATFVSFPSGGGRRGTRCHDDYSSPFRPLFASAQIAIGRTWRRTPGRATLYSSSLVARFRSFSWQSGTASASR